MVISAQLISVEENTERGQSLVVIKMFCCQFTGLHAGSRAATRHRDYLRNRECRSSQLLFHLPSMLCTVRDLHRMHGWKGSLLEVRSRRK